jgi:hypothetical protein
MLSLGDIAIYHYVKGNPAFDFGNPVTLASFTKQKEIIDLEHKKPHQSMVKSYILFFLANSYKLVHQGELLLSKTLDPEGLREKPLEKGLPSRDLTTASINARLTCVSRDEKINAGCRFARGLFSYKFEVA